MNGYSYVRRMAKGKTKKEKVPGLGGSFSYVRLGPPLFSEYRDFGYASAVDCRLGEVYLLHRNQPRHRSQEDRRKDGLIGETPVGGGTSYYLLYTPQQDESREMGTTKLRQLLKTDKNRNWVIYCEKIWIHPDELRKFELENNRRSSADARSVRTQIATEVKVSSAFRLPGRLKPELQTQRTQ